MHNWEMNDWRDVPPAPTRVRPQDVLHDRVEESYRPVAPKRFSTLIDPA
jgi:hypothetical protein